MRKYLFEHEISTVGFSRTCSINGMSCILRQDVDQRTGECLVFDTNEHPVPKWKLDRDELERCEAEFRAAVYAERARLYRDENPEVEQKPVDSQDLAEARRAAMQYRDWSDNPHSDQ